MSTLIIPLHFSHCVASSPTRNQFALPNKVDSIMCLEYINSAGRGLDSKGQFEDEGRVCTAESTLHLSVHGCLVDLVETNILSLNARD